MKNDCLCQAVTCLFTGRVVDRLILSSLIVIFPLFPIIAAWTLAGPEPWTGPCKAVNPQIIRLMVDGNVKPVEFVYKGKYEKERSVVYSSLTVRSSACRPVTLRSWPPGEIDYIVDDQPESATPEPSVTDNGKSPKTEDTAGQDDPFDPSWHPEPRMGISLEDLNSDGKEDILACFEHWAWGEGCHFYVFINCGEGRWKRVHYGTTYDRIFLSNTEHMRLKDIVFEGHCRSRRKLDLSREACGETRMCQFDGQQYRSVVLAEMHHDWAIGVKTISIRVVAGKGMNPGVVDLR